MQKGAKLLILVLTVTLTGTAFAQSKGEMAALESRLMARLEMRLAQETENIRGEQEALRVSVQSAIKNLAKSKNELDKRALEAIDSGEAAAGLEVLEERARARDREVTKSTAAGDRPGDRARAEEWRRIGALAYLDSTKRAVEGYENAVGFAPKDPHLLNELAALYDRQGRFADQAAIGRRLIALGDTANIARGYLHLGSAQTQSGSVDDSVATLKLAVVAARESGQPQILAQALYLQSFALSVARDFSAAEKAAEEAIQVAHANGNRSLEAWGRYALGGVSLVDGTQSLFSAKGKFERATQELEKALSAFVELDDRAAQGDILAELARLARLLGDARLSEGRARKAIAILEPLNARARIGFATQQLGAALAEQKRVAEAREAFRTSVDMAHQQGNPLYETIALVQWAQVEKQLDNDGEACRLITQAIAIQSTRNVGSQIEKDYSKSFAKSVC